MIIRCNGCAKRVDREFAQTCPACKVERLCAVCLRSHSENHGQDYDKHLDIVDRKLRRKKNADQY